MESREPTSNQGGQDQSGSDKPSTRPTPSGVPDEGRGTDAHHGSLDQGVRTGKADYEEKARRQSTAGNPDPDDRNNTDEE